MQSIAKKTASLPVATIPQQDNATQPTASEVKPGFLDFPGLCDRVPLGERTLREHIAEGRIPHIRLPGGRRLLFHWPTVQAALLRFEKGGAK